MLHCCDDDACLEAWSHLLKLLLNHSCKHRLEVRLEGLSRLLNHLWKHGQLFSYCCDDDNYLEVWSRLLNLLLDHSCKHGLLFSYSNVLLCWWVLFAFPFLAVHNVYFLTVRMQFWHAPSRKGAVPSFGADDLTNALFRP